MSVASRIMCILFIMLCSIGCVKKKSVGKFITIEHETRRKHNVLINKVHEKSWAIGYRYDRACPADARKNNKELQESITTAIQAWLQPLREMFPAAPIVNAFSYQQEPDMVNDDRKGNLLAFDFRVTFYCHEGISTALIGLSIPPDIYLKRGTQVTDAFMFSLVHELGHAMGLDDTYIERPEGGISTGGINKTVGTQPPSIMSSHLFPGAPHYIGKDDANGIIWLYKRTYENLALDNCLFPNYEFEQSPDGCRPTNPLIFEIRYGSVPFALQIIDQDKNLNINAHDQHGLTALHYAVTREQFTVVQKLLAHKNIDRDAKDPEGRTPLQLATELGLAHMVNLLSGRTTPATKITTWGEIKTTP